MKTERRQIKRPGPTEVRPLESPSTEEKITAQPRFSVGDSLTTIRYLPPLPKGATVKVVDLRQSEEEIEYLIHGQRRGFVGPIELWVLEEDLRTPFVL